MVSVHCCAGTSLAFFFVGYGLFLTSFGAPNWVVRDGENRGLWRYCQDGRCGDTIHDNNPTYFMVTQAMMCIALVCGVVSFVGYITWLCAASDRRVTQGFRIANGFTVLTGLFAGIGVLVFGIEFRYEAFFNVSVYGWAFWVGVASAVLLVFVGAGGSCGAESARDHQEKVHAQRASDANRISVYRESIMMGDKTGSPGGYGGYSPGYGAQPPRPRGPEPGDYVGAYTAESQGYRGYGYAADEVVDPGYHPVSQGQAPGQRYANLPPALPASQPPADFRPAAYRQNHNTSRSDRSYDSSVFQEGVQYDSRA